MNIINEQLDAAIERFRSLVDSDVAILSDYIKTVIVPALQELRERRASELKPCMKFINAGLPKQLEKIESEVAEVKVASAENNVEHVKEELVDVMAASVTGLAMLGCSAEEIREWCYFVNKKNSERGYLE